jgi:hypothetical protein
MQGGIVISNRWKESRLVTFSECEPYGAKSVLMQHHAAPGAKLNAHLR